MYLYMIMFHIITNNVLYKKIYWIIYKKVILLKKYQIKTLDPKWQNKIDPPSWSSNKTRKKQINNKIRPWPYTSLSYV